MPKTTATTATRTINIPLPRTRKPRGWVNPINTITATDKVLTTKQACDLLSINRSTLIRYANNKLIHRIYLNQEPRYSHASILALLNRGVDE